MEVQLDPDVSKREQNRQLLEVLAITEYRQIHNTRAAVSHRKTRCNDLRQLGIDLSKLTKCFDLM